MARNEATNPEPRKILDEKSMSREDMDYARWSNSATKYFCNRRGKINVFRNFMEKNPSGSFFYGGKSQNRWILRAEIFEFKLEISNVFRWFDIY